jgi:hypothetical protein
LRIAHIVGHGDQRALKQMLALKRKGHEVILLTRSSNVYVNYFDTVCLFGSAERLEELIKKTEADLFHIHCKPAELPATAIKTLRGLNRKFVYDVHDVDIVRFGKTNVDELYALLACDNFIFPSEAVEKKAWETVFDHLKTKPKTIALLPYFSLEDMVYPLIQPNPREVRNRINKLVYEGNIVYSAIENIRMFPYYDLRFTSFIFTSYGFEFHIYPVGIDFNQCRQIYETSGAILHIPVDYPTLVKEMSQYGWGFFGSFSRSPQADLTFANKIFDYLCAGIPSVVMNAEVMGRFLEDTGFGMVIRSFNDIEKLKNQDLWTEIQQKILAERVQYSMEENIGKLEAFYEEIMLKDPTVPCEDQKEVYSIWPLERQP